MESYSFGDFQLDLSRRMLTTEGSQVALNAKAFDLLGYLVVNHGRVVPKEEILDQVWKDQFVEEGNLSVQISHLRKALGDNASEPLLIATIPGKGYQFVGNVEPFKIDDSEPVADRSQNASAKWVIASIAAIVAISFATWFFVSSDRNDGRSVRSVAVLPFSDETGSGEFSYLGDGIAESVIFDLSRIGQLRVMSRDSSFRFRNDTPMPIKVGAGLDVDAILTGRILRLGDSIAVRTELVSASDGSEQKQITAPEGYDSVLTVEKSGRYIVFHSDRGSTIDIWRTDIDGSNPKQLTFGGKGFHPAPSPDGKWVYYRSNLSGKGHLCRVPIDGGEPEILNENETAWISFSPDGRYFAALHASDRSRLAIFSADTNQVLKQFELPKTGTLYMGTRWTPDNLAVTYRDNSFGYWIQPIDGSDWQDCLMKSFTIFPGQRTASGSHLSAGKKSVT